MKWFLPLICLSLFACTDDDQDRVTSADLNKDESLARLKMVVNHDPYAFTDEDAHAERIGQPENVQAFLQVYTHRLALALNDNATRQILRDAIHKAEKQEANLVDVVVGQSELLKKLSAGFVDEISEANLSGDLADLVSKSPDANAFVAASEALFGLELTLIDPTGAWDGKTALPVFHNPITDEKDTDLYDGFDPDGNALTMPFSMNGFQVDYPFLYLSQDEDFFRKPKNTPFHSETETGLWSLPTQNSLLGSLLDLLVAPVYANGADCYHDRSEYLVRFRFTDDHEGVGSPEMMIGMKVTCVYGDVPGNGNYDYVAADNINTDYPGDGQYYIEIYKHSGETCEGELFSYPDACENKEDWLNVKVWEDDAWPNPDDDVGEWQSVEMNPTGNADLTPTHPKIYGSPQDAYVRLTTYYQDQLIP